MGVADTARLKGVPFKNQPHLLRNRSRAPFRQLLAQLDHLQTRGTFTPIVAPADDHVALAGGVAMDLEIAAFKFEFNAHALPLAGLETSRMASQSGKAPWRPSPWNPSPRRTDPEKTTTPPPSYPP